MGLAATAFAIALITRPTNVFLIAFFFWVFWSVFSKRGFQATLVGLIPVAIPVILQMTVWKVMTGQFISYSYNDEGFTNWRSPFLFSTLFSSKHGLFFWSPILLFAIAGLVGRWRQLGLPDMLLRTLLVGAALLWFLNSSWHEWWFGDAFGGRAFLELTPLFVFGLAFLFHELSRRSRRLQVLVYSCVVITILFNYGLMALYVAHKIPRADYLF